MRVPLDLDLPYWIEDDAFDLEFHVRQSAVPSPGTWRQLMDVVARIHGGMTLRVFTVKLKTKSLRVWTFELPDGRLEQYQVAEDQ